MRSFLLNTLRSKLLIVMALVALTIPLQVRIDGMRGEFRSLEESLYLSSNTLRTLSLGYEEIVADMYWLRVLQYFGSRKQVDKDPQLLYHYFDIITDLDPHFVNAYRYGGTFLADRPPIGLGNIELGTMLLEKGMANNPQSYQLPLEGAFIYFLYVKDYEKAAELFAAAAEKPGLGENKRNAFRGMAALCHSRGGDRDLARQVWTYMLETSTSEGRKNFAIENLKRIETLDIEDSLTSLAVEFEKRTGRWPLGPKALVRAGMLSSIPDDPYEGRFVLLKGIRAAKSTGLAEKDIDFNLGYLTARVMRFKRTFGRFPRGLPELRAYLADDPTTEFPEHPYGGQYGYFRETGEITRSPKHLPEGGG